MSLALLALAALAVINPARVRLALPQRDHVLVGALGAALAWLMLVPTVLAARLLLDQVDIAASTLRMGVGVLLLLQGAAVALAAPPHTEPGLPGRRAALVPVAFPVTLTPGLGGLAVSASVDHPAPVALAVLALALATIPGLALISSQEPPVRRRVLTAVGRATGALLLVSGVALLMNGVFDI